MNINQGGKIAIGLLLLLSILTSSFLLLGEEIGYQIGSVRDVKEFFASYGWEADISRCEIDCITFPPKMDVIYHDYNEIQKKSGFDISPYMGKKIKRYRCVITNHPVGKEIAGHVFTYRGKVIAADLLDPALDGFITGVASEEGGRRF